MDAKQFGMYISKLRNKRGLTVRKLDQLSGVSHSYISQLENGNRDIPSPDILRKLSKTLGIDYMEMMVTAGYVTSINGSDCKEFIEEIEQLRKENLQLRQTIKELSKLL